MIRARVKFLLVIEIIDVLFGAGARLLLHAGVRLAHLDASCSDSTCA